jgi:FMN-dependent NADH-azoreductase
VKNNYFNWLKTKQPKLYKEVEKIKFQLSKEDIKKLNKYDTIVVTPMYVGETRASISNYFKSL